MVLSRWHKIIFMSAYPYRDDPNASRSDHQDGIHDMNSDGSNLTS